MNIEELTTLQNLNDAFYKVAKISHWKETTQRYKVNLLVNNVKLQEDLRNGKYKISPTTNFALNERGKLRIIKAPAMRDRIIQKVICQKILIPQLSKYFIYDNYASLKDRGTSFARKRIEVLLRKYINTHGSDGYILQIDIKKYFDSIDHEILKRMVRQYIHEPEEVMSLIDYMIDTSSDSDKGLNLGAEIPQILAIFFISGIDNYIKTVKGMKYYGRYMDDMFVISDNKKELRELLEEIKIKLNELGLEANEKKTQITPLKHGFTFMQTKYNIVDGKILKRLTRSKIVRERRRLKKYKKLFDKGLMSEIDIFNNYKSWRGNVEKDYNACDTTLSNMDKLFNSLFPDIKKPAKKTRNELINEYIKKGGYQSV